MPSFLIFAVVIFLVWLLVALAGHKFIKQMFWMGFLSVSLFLTFIIFNIDWVLLVVNNTDFWIWITSLFITTFCAAGLAAIAYEWIFHIKWKKPAHAHHHHVLLLILGPLVMLAGFILMPPAGLYFLFIGLVIEVIILMLVRPDLVIDSFFSGIFLGLVFSVLFSLLFANIPGSLGGTFSGITFVGVPVELIGFFFLFGSLWGPWYEVVKDYHPKKLK